jgi:hypothetical protein
MIVIKTANGDRFINEAEVKNVQHNKSACIVTIKFKDGTFDVAYGVESMYYTNKADTEIRDNGLMLGSTTTDKEYWKEMAQSAEQFVERLIDRRGELESFILDYIGTPEVGSYQERFIREMKEARSERANNYEDELRQYRDFPYFRRVREDSKLKGDEAEKEFTKLTKALQTQTEFAERYKEAHERIMKRNLWERIANKKTYL